jgi:hypothetical protein
LEPNSGINHYDTVLEGHLYFGKMSWIQYSSHRFMPLPHRHYYLTRDNIPSFLYVDDIVDTNKKNYETIAILKAIGPGE